jgi:2-oxoisovalerate dehydrogenase E1 component
MLQLIILIRRFEQTLLELKDQDLIHGPVHSSVGQEAVAVGVATALGREDKITSTHRAHHQYLAKVLCARAEQGFNPLNGLTEEMYGEVEILLSEIMGLAKGCCGGRGGSMHLCKREAGVLGTNAIVAGGVPHAVGAGWADRLQGKDCISICFVGDGGLYQGVLHEASNLAALWKAPTIFFVENNQYAVATPTTQSCSVSQLCEVSQAYGMPGASVDGMNPVAVKFAVEQARAGWLPCYIEAKTYRYFHHGGKIPGSAFGYREKDEESRWRERDPLNVLPQQLLRLGILDDQKHATLNSNAESCIRRAVESCTAVSREGTKALLEGLWPSDESLEEGLRDDRILRLVPFIEEDEVECSRQVRFSDAIAESMGRWLEKDPTVVVWGEEVANMKGGAYGATRGLSDRFPDRVLNTPISEAGFCGLAAGAAMNGMHPVVEIMYSSFVLVAADQIFNQIGQLSHIYGGNVDLPLVLRLRVATGFGFGAQHSLDPAALFHLFPGWRIFAPSTPFDYVGMFNVAMNSSRPIVILEHQDLYGRSGNVPEGPLDHLVRPGRAKVIRAGTDITLATYSSTTLQAQAAARQLAEDNLDVEVIDLRTLDRASTDWETIGRSLKKTGRLLTVEQAPRSGSIGPHIIAECLERFSQYLKQPPRSLAGPSVPVPVSRRLEELCFPNAELIQSKIREFLGSEP